MDTILIILMKYVYKHILTYVTSMENACKNPKRCYQAIVACYFAIYIGYNLFGHWCSNLAQFQWRAHCGIWAIVVWWLWWLANFFQKFPFSKSNSFFSPPFFSSSFNGTESGFWNPAPGQNERVLLPSFFPHHQLQGNCLITKAMCVWRQKG